MRASREPVGTDEKIAIAYVNESRSWARAGVEPSTTALLADPIAILLMRADRLTTREVESVLRVARLRRVMRRRGSTDLRLTPPSQGA